MTNKSHQNMLEGIRKIIEEEISFTQQLFNINSKPTDSDVENLTQSFSYYLQNTKNDYNYFLGLLEHFAYIRPKYKHIVPKLYQTIISFFPSHKVNIESEVLQKQIFFALYSLLSQ